MRGVTWMHLKGKRKRFFAISRKKLNGNGNVAKSVSQFVRS